MKELFIDSANIQDIKEAIESKVVTGITTNPSIMAKEIGAKYESLVQTLYLIAKENEMPISIEIPSIDPEVILKQAKTLVPYSDFINIKIPIGFEYLGLISFLESQKVKVNCTCCLSLEQMILAAKSGATYISLFYNRVKDEGGSPDYVLREAKKFIQEEGLKTKIIVGSIRKPTDVSSAWFNGANIVTCSLKVMKEMTKHPGTDKALVQFMKDFETWQST